MEEIENRTQCTICSFCEGVKLIFNWCNLFDCWCDDVKEVIDNTYIEICDFDCAICEEREGIKC